MAIGCSAASASESPPTNARALQRHHRDGRCDWIDEPVLPDAVLPIPAELQRAIAPARAGGLDFNNKIRRAPHLVAEDAGPFVGNEDHVWLQHECFRFVEHDVDRRDAHQARAPLAHVLIQEDHRARDDGLVTQQGRRFLHQRAPHELLPREVLDARQVFVHRLPSRNHHHRHLATTMPSSREGRQGRSFRTVSWREGY